MSSSKREFLRAVAAAMGAIPSGLLFAKDGPAETGNFGYIYSDPAIREQFKTFLVNVFRLYPENDLHDLIFAAVRQGLSDGEIYRRVQRKR